MKKEQKIRLSLTATAAAISLAFGTMPVSVQAETINWTGGAYHLVPDGIDGSYWVDGGSNWTTSGNWTAAVPSGTDTVNIDRPTVAPPVVGWIPHNVVQVTDTTPQASIVNVGTATNNSMGQVQINNGGTLTVQNTTNIGQVQGSNGVITVASGGKLANNGNFIVGDAGTGTHNVSGLTETTGKVIIGNQSTGNGSVVVDGTMRNHDTLAVGENGTGQLTVNGLVQTDGKVVIANQGNSIGSVVVTGNMVNHDALTVGENGNGTLEINGGTVTTDGSTVIASRGNSTSYATLNEGQLTTGGNLTVAEEGTGSLTLSNESTVSTTGTTIIGDRTSSRGSVVVGSSSTLNSAKDFLLGENGEASLLVETGGKVNNVNGVMADRRGSRSDATVTGAGSTWTSSGDLTVGYGGDATLNLDRNGTVAVGQEGDGTVYVGFERSSSGTINVGATTKNANDAIEAGHLDASHLVFGQGQNEVNFNHTDADHQFKAGMEGQATVNQIAGETVLQGDSSKFSGQTNVAGGQLVLNNKLAGEMNVGTDGTLRVGYDNGETGEILSDISNQGLVQFDRSNTYEYDKVISGSGRVEQIGTGKTIFTADNTYTGGTSIENGTLQLGNGGTAGSIVGDVDVATPGTLAFDRSDDVVFAGVISGQGNVRQQGTVSTRLTGNSDSFAGQTTVASGKLILGDGAAAGWLGGDAQIDTGAALAFDREDRNTYAGTISGTGNLRQEGTGETILTADSGNFAGHTDVVNGTLRLGDSSIAPPPLGRAPASEGWLGGNATVGENGTLIFDRANVNTFAGSIDGSGNIRQVGTGKTILAGDASNFGGTSTVTAGTLEVGDGAESGWLGGNVVNDATFAFNRNDTNAFGGIVSGEGVVEQRGSGRTILTNGNTYAGGTNIRNGALQLGDGGTTGSIVGNVQIDSTGELAFKRADHYTFGGVVSGDGRIAQIGTGVTELTGDSSGFAGATQVRQGVLAVNGKLGGTVDVQDTAVLRGVGQVGTAVVHQGGTISPGNSIGTLAVTGDLTQDAGSTYDVELETTGARDRLEVAGITTLDEGSLIRANKVDSARYELDRRYEVLSSAGGVNGRYNLIDDTNVSTFYSLVDNYDANNVYLDVQQVRNFQEAGYTDNQRSAATGAQSLKGLRVPAVVPPTHNPLFKAIAYLQSDAQARDAFDQISGEIHASTRTGLIEDSRLIRDATNSRLQSAFGRSASPTDESDTSKGKSDVAIWAQGIGSWGQTKDDGNAAKLRRDTYGFIGGADVEVADNVRVGALAGYSKTDFKASDRNSTNKSDNFHLGLYGGAQFGQLGLRAGAAYTWSKLDSNRSVSFAGYSDSLSADYRAATAQLFAEVGYQLDVSEKVKLEPFANLAYVNLKTKGFSENGGAAALNSESRTDNQTFATLGLRASTAFESASGKETTVYGTAGWRHAFSSKIPQSTFSFQDSAAFNIDGVAISRNTAVLGAGFDSAFSKNLNLGLSYSGQIGDGISDHGIRVNASYKF